jgi:hypothetical protein
LLTVLPAPSITALMTKKILRAQIDCRLAGRDQAFVPAPTQSMTYFFATNSGHVPLKGFSAVTF